MKIHISGSTIDTGTVSHTRETPSGNRWLTLYDMILSSRTESGSAPKLHSPCGGHLKCSKCTVCAVIEEESFPEFSTGDYTFFHRDLSSEERSTAFDAMHVPSDLRSRTVVCLACGMPAFPIITDVYLPDPEEIRGASLGSQLLPGTITPVVLSKEISLIRPTVENPIDVYTNLYRAVFGGDSPVTAADFGYTPAEYTAIPSISDEVVDLTANILRDTAGPVNMKVAVSCAPIRGNNVLSLTASVVLSISSPADYPYVPITPLGLAIDLGTTTVALSLWNLETGEQTSSTVITNPQRSFGADVISRMSYAAEHGSDSLRSVIHTAIRDAVLSMTGNSEEGLNNILFVTVAGNSVMEHLFCGKSTDSISKAPFYMTESFGCSFPASSILTAMFCRPGAPVYLAPLAASYIGGDITMGLAYLMEASPRAKTEKSLFLDLGTNGEICVISGEDQPEFLLAATAAGPALEGAHIKMGMSAIPGAVSKAEIPIPPTGEFLISSISDAVPAGICGSGLIDVIACCLDTGLITSYGRICDDGEAEEEEYEDIYQIYEHKISETDDGKLQIALTDSVFLHESDIRQVQTAKAAIAAGSQTLLSAAGLTDDDLDAVYLAGSFGGGINPRTSSRIGLLPDVSPDIIRALGNTSAKGAAGFLLYSGVRESLRLVLAGSRYTELSGSPQFTELYVDNMVFGLPE